MNGMTPIIKTFIRGLTAPVLLFGFYLFLHGHISHGAGFAGGVMIALAFVLIMLAFGKEELDRRVTVERALFVAAIMSYFIIALALIGIISSAGFAGNFLEKGKTFALFSSGTVIVVNAALCLVAAASLLLIFLCLIPFGRKGSREEKA